MFFRRLLKYSKHWTCSIRNNMTDTSTKPHSGHWANGLVASMNDPSLMVISTDTLVLIKDKYPKAMRHFLVLPKQDIASIYHLNKSHLPLLAEIKLLAANAVELTGSKPSEFQMGYHASPSMQRLHLHVISRDFDSPCLKTKVHWNSFTTEFFLAMEDVHRELRETGAVIKNAQLHDECMKRPLKCHRCDFAPKNMPDLKRHIVKPHAGAIDQMCT